MNTPIGKLHGSFTQWLQDRKQREDRYKEQSKKTLEYTWYKMQGKVKLQEKDKYNKELFDTKDIQEAYKQYLQGQGVNGDPIIQKFQSGNIQADERAFYIRHAPISHLMCTGFSANTNSDFFKNMYIAHIKQVLDLSKDSKDKIESGN